MDSGTRQRGLSSVEMVLVLPFVLVLILLLANVGKFWHAKLDNQISARTSAWRSAMFNSVPCGANVDGLLGGVQSSSFPVPSPGSLLGGVEDEVNAAIVDTFGQACGSDSQAGEIHAAMRKGPSFGGHKPGLASEFEKTPNPPGAITGYGFHQWSTWSFKDQAVYNMKDTHTLDITGMWYREDLPFGHDDYLDKKLLQGQRVTDSNISEAELEEREQQAKELEEWANCVEDAQKNPFKSVDDCGPQPEAPDY